MTVRRAPAVIVAALLALAVSPAFSFGVARAGGPDPALAARVLALAPDHVRDVDVRETLARREHAERPAGVGRGVRPMSWLLPLRFGRRRNMTRNKSQPLSAVGAGSGAIICT